MAATWGVFSALAALLLAGSCSGVEPRGGIGHQCALNSECAAPLICRLGYCRNECVASEDCLAPAQCLHDDQGRGVCQTPAEKSCALQTDCTSPLVCRFRQCVNECTTERDCPAGQRCREGGACIDDVRGRCEVDRDCPGDLVCRRDGYCRQACFEDRDCRDNDACLDDAGFVDCPMIRQSYCRDPDRDGLNACFFECMSTGDCPTGRSCIGGLCRFSCPCPGDGWVCDADAVCVPDIPDPLTEDGGVGDGGTDGGGDGGMDAGDGGLDGGDGGMDAGDAGPLGCSGSVLTGVRDLALDALYGCAVRGSGATTEVLCWGQFGDIGLADASTSSLCPVAVPALAGQDIVQLEAGGSHACAVLASGNIICWGVNISGEIGLGTTSMSETPTMHPTITDAAGVSLSAGITCIWRRGADASCWGSNLWGSLGNGPCTRCTSFVMGTAGGDFASPQPVTVVSLPRDISATAGPVCALTGTGDVFCWGKDNQNELGPFPFPLTGVERVEVSDSSYGCVSLTSDGSLHCWGNNFRGQLADGTTTSREAVMPVVGLPAGRVVDFSLSDHACAVVDDGSVWCWGNAEGGAVMPGVVAASAVTAPHRVIASGATRVETGVRFSCALVGDELRCWGENNFGKLGTGSTDPESGVIEVVAP
jgi:alpha-tubulin suppressor-like RCC1 family protein